MYAETCWTYTEDDNEEEINVSNVVELEIQVLRNETQRRVLCGSDLVPDKLLFSVALLIQLLGGQRLVHVDVSGLGT